MEFWMLFAAVVLVAQAAKVPQQVAVAVPSEVLVAPPPTSVDPDNTVTPPVKDHVHKKEEMQEVMITVQPETKIMMPTVPEISNMPQQVVDSELKRKTRAVPFTEHERTKQHTVKHSDMQHMMKDKWTQRNYKMTSHRSMRSVQMGTTIQPVVTVTENPANDKSSDSSVAPAPTSSPSPAMSTIDPCDLLCTKFEFEPICASNGLCLHEFSNQCILETYNCRHPKGKFAATKDDACQMHWLTKCDESEMI